MIKALDRWTLLEHLNCRCTPLCTACHNFATGVRSRKAYSLQEFLRYEAELEETDEEDDSSAEEDDSSAEDD